MKYLITYDARPLMPMKQYVCKVKKYLQTGMKMQCIEDDHDKVAAFEKHYGNVIFKDDGTARGWNTLRWSPYIESAE